MLSPPSSSLSILKDENQDIRDENSSLLKQQTTRHLFPPPLIKAQQVDEKEQIVHFTLPPSSRQGFHRPILSFRPKVYTASLHQPRMTIRRQVVPKPPIVDFHTPSPTWQVGRGKKNFNPNGGWLFRQNNSRGNQSISNWIIRLGNPI